MNKTNEKILELMNKDMEDFKKELIYYNDVNANGKYNLLLGIRPENIYLVGDAHNNNPATIFQMEAEPVYCLKFQILYCKQKQVHLFYLL